MPQAIELFDRFEAGTLFVPCCLGGSVFVRNFDREIMGLF
ncbi:MAG: hypothetical protein CM15mP58_07860 [Burkholderiaceae bacterium]|nr:MAG: hypothetical protein CM15mP58_07860 [Burkholderiaceae bacterium]